MYILSYYIDIMRDFLSNIIKSNSKDLELYVLRGHILMD
jgi:hypothetical protein